MTFETRLVGTRTGEKVHTLTGIDGTWTSKTDCGVNASGMFDVTVEVAREAHASGRLCRNCVGNAERFFAHLEAGA